jgi:hypothetical protein
MFSSFSAEVVELHRALVRVHQDSFLMFYSKLGYLNDLWIFNVTNGEWNWLSGSSVANEPSSYGTKGISYFNKYPGARAVMGMAIDAILNVIYIHGGYGTGMGGAEGLLMS